MGSPLRAAGGHGAAASANRAKVGPGGAAITSFPSGAASGVTAIAAAVFFWARVVHAVGYIAGIPYVRTLFFSIGVFACLAIAWEILT